MKIALDKKIVLTVTIVIACTILVRSPLAMGALTGRIAFSTSGRMFIMNADGTSRHEVPLPYEEYPLLPIGSLQWSTDGEWLTFYGTIGLHQAQIFIVRPDGSDFCCVTCEATSSIGNIVWPTFSPDASEIAYHKAYGHLYTIITDCNAPDPCDHGVRVSHTRWSPAGRYIAYSNWAIPTYDSDLFLYDLSTGTSTQITHHAPGQAFNYAAWSPDGTKLAVQELDHNTDKYDVAVIEIDFSDPCNPIASDPCNLTADWPTSDEGYPSWSPDGKYIVFNSDISGNQDIWYMRTDGTNRINITNSPEDESWPTIGVGLLRVLSPNGGESWVAGTTQEIDWVTAVDADIAEVKIQYSTNNGQDWNDVNTVPNIGSYEWLVPEVTSNECLVRVSNLNDINIYDVSDDVFTIFQCRRSDVIYSQDFSSDPGWTTNSPSKMYWDQQKGKYHFEITGLGEYAFVPITYSPSVSNKLEFDIEIVHLEYNSAISFGLYDPDMREQEPVNWKANYGRGDGGNGASVGYYGDSSSDVFPPGYDFLYEVNTGYHNVLVYDATAQKLMWQVTRISDGAVVADYSSPDGIGTFTGIDRICATRVPQGATTEGYIDNVVLSVSYLGKLVGDLNDDCYSDFRDFAIFAGYWLECGNPFDPDCGVE